MKFDYLRFASAVQGSEIPIQQIAADTKVSRTTLYEWMNGTTKPTAELLATACRVIGHQLTEFFYEECTVKLTAASDDQPA